MVIHGCIDGLSRLVTFLKCSSNNCAQTVLNLFIPATRRYRMPLKIRTDHGTENVSVAKYMLEFYGLDARPVITGKSVHNQRIERLWVDVFIYVTQQFYNVFRYLESDYNIDPGNEMHLFVLHYIFIPRINNMLEKFVESWNITLSEQRGTDLHYEYGRRDFTKTHIFFHVQIVTTTYLVLTLMVLHLKYKPIMTFRFQRLYTSYQSIVYNMLLRFLIPWIMMEISELTLYYEC